MLLHLRGGVLSGWVKPVLSKDDTVNETIAALWLALSVYNPELIIAGFTEATPCVKSFLGLIRGSGLKSVSRLKGMSLTGRIEEFSGEMSDMPHFIPIMSALCADALKPSCISYEGQGEISVFERSCSMAEAAGADCMRLSDRFMIKAQTKRKLPGGIVNTGADWRVVCGGVLLSFLCFGELTISAAELMDEISPGFWNCFVNLGGKMEWK
ncbi:MAG: hypothetical protein GX061_01000 [Eubacteriaceae bacterium]|nr:hypothetical protein [Eubacteriaceae bacterium]